MSIQSELSQRINDNLYLSRLTKDSSVIATSFLELVRSYVKDYGNTKNVAQFVLGSNRAVVGATIYQFFNSGTEAGVNGFPKDELMLVQGIRILSGVNAALSSTVWVQGLTEGNLLNATIDILVDGNTLLKQYPLTLPTASADLDNALILLNQPIVIRPQVTFQVNLNLPAAVATANTNMRIELCGLKTI